MIGLQTSIGDRPHRIALGIPGPPVPDGDGGYTNGMVPLDPPEMFARIQPATTGDLEANFAGTIVATATHLVTLPYHPGVTLQTLIDFNGRTFNVVGRANREERNADLVLLCTEQVA